MATCLFGMFVAFLLLILYVLAAFCFSKEVNALLAFLFFGCSVHYWFQGAANQLALGTLAVCLASWLCHFWGVVHLKHACHGHVENSDTSLGLKRIRLRFERQSGLIWLFQAVCMVIAALVLWDLPGDDPLAPL